jgi:hypothetical protein
MKLERRDLLRKDHPDGQRKTSEELRPSAELTILETDQGRNVGILSVAIGYEMGVSEGLFLSFLM